MNGNQDLSPTICTNPVLENECQERLSKLQFEKQEWFSKDQMLPTIFSDVHNLDSFLSEPSLDSQPFFGEFSQRTQKLSHLIRKSEMSADLFKNFCHRPLALYFESLSSDAQDSTSDLRNGFLPFSSSSFPNLKVIHSKPSFFSHLSCKASSFNQVSIVKNKMNIAHGISLVSSCFRSSEPIRQEELVSESEDDESTEEMSLGEPSDITSISPSLISLNGSEDREKKQLLYKIALELVTTEQTYVSILYLLDQVFAFRVDQENRAYSMFPQEVLNQMFSILKSLYKLHHDFLLPQLEERIEVWDSKPKIGDIMKNLAPFLKMYSDYVKNYDNSVSLINTWHQKQPRFALIMDEIHEMPECGNLTIQHHMLTPVQRIPRYELLLKDYLKRLPPDAEDRTDTEKALELVSTAANHANDAMKKIDKFKKLIEIQEMVGGIADLASPTRELIKEGKIIKISARSGDHQERYIFLFTDLLLVCSQRLIANRVVSGPVYRVRARLDMEDLTVEEGDNLETANSFYVRTPNRSMELYTQTPEEKAEWIQVFNKVIAELFERKSSLRVGPNKPIESAELGKLAPDFIKQEGIQQCMMCGNQFSAFRRKHHCRACGRVSCAKCLSYKAHLEYDPNHKSCKVCGDCYAVLSTSQTNSVLDSPPMGQQRGVLEVSPSDTCVISGYLFFKLHGRGWVYRWFSLHPDFVLYSFKSHHDEKALTSMPVPGYEVERTPPLDGKDNVFKLFHKNRVYYFQSIEKNEMEKWIEGLEKASRAESAIL